MDVRIFYFIIIFIYFFSDCSNNQHTIPTTPRFLSESLRIKYSKTPPTRHGILVMDVNIPKIQFLASIFVDIDFTRKKMFEQKMFRIKL